MNFLSAAAQLAEAFHDTFELINMERWLHHVENCPDPMCGLVMAVDGTCKVVREICGARLPIEEDDQLDPSLSDVQNVMHRDSLRKKVCDNMPGSQRGTKGRYCRSGYCATCQERLQESENIELRSDSQLVPVVLDDAQLDNVHIPSDAIQVPDPSTIPESESQPDKQPSQVRPGKKTRAATQQSQQSQVTVEKKKQTKSGGSSKSGGKSKKRLPAERSPQKASSTQSKSQKCTAQEEVEDEFDSQVRPVQICI